MKKHVTHEAGTKKSGQKKLRAIEFEVSEAVPAVINATANPIARGEPMKSAEAPGPEYSVDKRRNARREHSNHFTSRAPKKSQ